MQEDEEEEDDTDWEIDKDEDDSEEEDDGRERRTRKTRGKSALTLRTRQRHATSAPDTSHPESTSSQSVGTTRNARGKLSDLNDLISFIIFHEVDRRLKEDN